MTDPITAELVPADAGPRSGGTLAVPGADARDALARAWIESHENDSRHTAERYARDVPGWSWRDGTADFTAERAPGSFFRWADENGYDVFVMLPWHVEQYRRHLQTAEHVGRYKASRRLSDSTIAGKIAAASSFYSYCQRQSRHQVIPNPTLGSKRPKVSTRSKTLGLSKDEVDTMLRVAQQRGSREYALVMLLVTTGLRVSEMCELDTGDLVRDGDEWMVRAVRKGSSDSVLVPVPDPTARALRRYMRGRRGPMFQRTDGQRMTRQAAAYTLGALAKDAGITKTITPHSLRHTATTLALQAGVAILDVQALMGHASVSTTARYDRALRMRDNPAAAALGAMFEDGLPDAE
ncbi:MAG: integrase family protein [Streptosporangiaceae bacterium]|nr:integrase family protein [Streptosporangiaceae bacterium]